MQLKLCPSGDQVMKRIQGEHGKIEEHLRNIKRSCEEMREDGLGGYDFEALYVSTKLIPTIREIFPEVFRL
jgi:hypothetical protein